MKQHCFEHNRVALLFLTLLCCSLGLRAQQGRYTNATLARVRPNKSLRPENASKHHSDHIPPQDFVMANPQWLARAVRTCLNA